MCSTAESVRSTRRALAVAADILAGATRAAEAAVIFPGAATPGAAGTDKSFKKFRNGERANEPDFSDGVAEYYLLRQMIVFLDGKIMFAGL